MSLKRQVVAEVESIYVNNYNLHYVYQKVKEKNCIIYIDMYIYMISLI